MITAVKRLDSTELVSRQQITLRFIDADLIGNRLGRVRVITGQHDRLDAQLVQLSNGFAAGLLHCIGDGKQRNRARRIKQQHHGLALHLQRIEPGFQLWRTQAQFFHQTMVAQVIHLAVDLALHSAPTQRLERTDFMQGQAAIGGLGNRLGNRVI